MNEQIREALVGALHEVAASSSRDTFADLVSMINAVRSELVLTYMTDKYVSHHVWPLLRKDVDLTKAVLNATANFTMAIPDIDSAISVFASKAISFTPATAIVDDDILGKSVTPEELADTLKANQWLYFILYASIHMYLVNGVGIQYKITPESKGKPNA